MNKLRRENETGKGSLEFDRFFKWERIILGTLGIWPTDVEPASKFRRFGTAGQTFLLGYVVATEWADLVKIWGQFDPMLENLCANFGQSLALFKILILGRNIETVKRCLNEVRTDWQLVGNTGSNFQIMLRRAKIGRIFTILGSGIAFATGVSYAVIPLTMARPENATEIFAPLPFRSAHFYQPVWTPAYELTYLIQSISCYASSLGYSAPDCFFTALVLHTCGQMEILERAIRDADARDPIIGPLVERHIRLVEYVEVVEGIFSHIIFAQLFVSSLAICAIGFKFITSVDDGRLPETAKFVFYLSAILLQIFLYCYAGQCLIDENVRLSHAAYECSWYGMSRSNARSFLLIQSRAQKPLQVMALKFCVMSHECFANILSTSASYLSVLRAVI